MVEGDLEVKIAKIQDLVSHLRNGGWLVVDSIKIVEALDKGFPLGFAPALLTFGAYCAFGDGPRPSGAHPAHRIITFCKMHRGLRRV